MRTTADKEDCVRVGLEPEGCAEIVVCLTVNLAEAHRRLICQQVRHVVEDGRERVARAAPRRTKVEEPRAGARTCRGANVARVLVSRQRYHARRQGLHRKRRKATGHPVALKRLSRLQENEQSRQSCKN